MTSRAPLLAFAWSAAYWIAAAVAFSVFRFGAGVDGIPLALAALAGVAPTTALVTWLYLRRLGSPHGWRASLWFSLALVLLHPPADVAFLSRFAPEILWNHLIGWKGVLFYGVLAVVPLLTARFRTKTARP